MPEFFGGHTVWHENSINSYNYWNCIVLTLHTMREYARISDYGLIGNCRSSALVSKYGSIDWCCMPEFHSPAIFSAILDNETGGTFSISPVNEYSATQDYISHTNVLETNFDTAEGSVKITDCFVAMHEHAKMAELFPDHEILRIVEGISGSVKMKLEYRPKLMYGRRAAKLKDFKKLGIHLYYKENICVLQSSPQHLNVGKVDDRIETEFVINNGERVIFSLSCSTQHPAIIPELATTAIKRLQQTISYWQEWAGKCKYDGIFKEEVVRSALTLKLLTHAPSGAIVAAPTTSLPEHIGGIRNWDYRYCWLRDASFTVRALLKLGYHDEAHAYMSWILYATSLTQPKLQVMYNVFGIAHLREKELSWLKGYKNSKPVRIGNAAYDQLQLDIYGEVLDAVYAYSEVIDSFDTGTKKFIIGLGKTICRTWMNKDEGIWEIRSEAVHHTHSKVMAWLGLDRLIKLCRQYGWANVPLQEFEETRNRIAQAVEAHGFNDTVEAYVNRFNGAEPGAVLLTLSLVGYCSADDQRMLSTVDYITKRLSHNGFVYRYRDVDDGLPGDEGAFLVGNFWLVENLAKTGKLNEAIELFNSTISHAPPHGLLSEEIDPISLEWLGNYPQAFSHIGLINAVLSINECLLKKES